MGSCSPQYLTLNKTTEERRSAVVVVSAWLEGGRGPMRARLQRITRPGSDSDVITAAGIDEICARVREWLDALAGDAPATGR
jgi:hypothetical protein